MRLDKFLKLTKVFKRRSLSTESAKLGFVCINGKVAKPSHNVGIGDIIEISTDLFYKKIKVLDIPPEGRNMKKASEYICVISDESRKPIN
jgi:ribosomal 50S subunit-recycling heat shock protein